ncbi:TKL protein kinase [Phytophthora nicotianae]|uniref:TKL protein kinase n=1 Tax=Phytophthora nicotianae TaxID=4792 RepID=W2JC94_PHYNI|nr:TKL protein kinase [Phytophthora nicotianae]
MTAGVGTSLWMAPEVMLGEKYDVKADIFSFGVVLSELDVHRLPFAQAKQRHLHTTGRQLTQAALLQRITTGVARGGVVLVTANVSTSDLLPILTDTPVLMIHLLWILLHEILPVAAVAMYSIATYYSDDVCSSNYAYQVHAVEVANCTSLTCSNDGLLTASTSDDAESIECSTDYVTSMISMLNDVSYIIVLRFEDNNCSTLHYGYGTTTLGRCAENKHTGGYSTSILHSDGSADIQYFSDSSCSVAYASETVNNSAKANHECSSSNYVWYTSRGPEISNDNPTATISSRDGSHSGHSNYDHIPQEASDSSSDVSALTIVCSAFSCIMLAQVAVIIVLYRRLKKQTPVETRSGLWDDDTITATRIPRNKISIKKLLCRGAFGEVYCGFFNGQQVAVKMLLSATRSNLQHVNEFLTEAKMTAMMDHPHIVYYVGVAWDSLSDLCVVLEFMDGGDLRTLLNKYEAEHHPIGIDREKAIIALHICHALTYLHSLRSPVIHRDLKSRNVLLNQSMTAKLTDFGISRERLDRTMTAGVGTSLWMAPEVMLGERYGVKADIFSLGVVISELDVHTLPYAQVKRQSRETEGRELGDATLLQRVSTGEITVEFSCMSPSAVVELGRSCVSVDPADRPTAAGALYRLQVILTQELSSSCNDVL